MKTRLFGRMVLLLALIFCLMPTFASADGLTLTNGSNAITTPNVATSITGFQIVGPASDTTPVKLRATYGTLSLSTVSGVTMSGNNSGTVSLSGTVEKLNQALSTLKYTRGSTGSDTLEVSLVNANEVFFTTNGHLYKFVSGSYSWSAAKSAAEGQSAYGATGYLATITSSAENNFVYTRITGDGWLGTTDQETEKTWKWVTGPEAGTAYFQENPSGGGGSAIGGRYNGWASGEPNDAGGEDCGYMYASQGGKWNDFPCSTQQGYVVEFGADGALPTVVAANISITTADVPAVTTLSPSNGSASISTTANLVVGFTKTVTAGTGTVSIRRSSDDSLAEAIDVTSGMVTGGGTNTITINPSVTLEEGVQYYVTVSNTAFKDASNNLFEGISGSSTWVFTTEDITPPIISGLVTVDVTNTSATVTWETNEPASTQLRSGLTSNYGTTSSEADTAPRVTSHSVSLSGLLACTTYHYAAVSKDAFGNSSTSMDIPFTTTGCQATPLLAQSEEVSVVSGGTSTVTDMNNSITVTVPANVTNAAASVVIQIKAVPSEETLGVIGRPSSVPNEVGLTVFDVKAIVNGTTILDSFDHPVTITYTYTDEDVKTLDESTFWLYHFHNDEWLPLDSCELDKPANTITCTTSSFSIFGLFGKVKVADQSYISGGTLYGCTDPKALNYMSLAISRPYMCTYPAVVPTAAPVAVRDLQVGMKGQDVLELQKFLNKLGFTITAKGPGSKGNETTQFGPLTKKALIKFQKQYGIKPAVGYYGPVTRGVIAEKGL